jgi:hypothetical protein
MSLIHARFLEPTRMAPPAMADIRRPATGPVLDLTDALAPESEHGPLRRLTLLVHMRAARAWTKEEAREVIGLVEELGAEVRDA